MQRDVKFLNEFLTNKNERSEINFFVNNSVVVIGSSSTKM